MWESIKDFVIEHSKTVIGIGIIILVTFVLLLVIKLVINRYIKKTENKRARTLAKLIQGILRYVMIISAIVAIMGLLGFDVTALLAGVGILGLIIGLGAQSLIEDFLAGIGIIFEDYYELDETVEINGFKGVVSDIGLRSTKVRNWKGEVKIIGNGKINELINYSRTYSMAVVNVLIDFGEDLDKVIPIVEENLQSITEIYPEIIEGPNVVGIGEIAESGAILQIRSKTLPEGHYGVERGLRKRVLQILKENNIKVPYTTIAVQEEEK